MIARYITDVRRFMAGLLTGNIMDDYLLSEGIVTTYCTFSIDGTYRKEFFEEDLEDPVPSHVRWSDVKPYVLSLIRGKHTPLSFQFTFALPEANIPVFLREAGIERPAEDFFGFYLNFRFDGTRLLLTTAASLKAFALDKEHDRAWDMRVLSFLDRCGIESEEAS